MFYFGNHPVCICLFSRPARLPINVFHEDHPSPYFYIFIRGIFYISYFHLAKSTYIYSFPRPPPKRILFPYFLFWPNSCIHLLGKVWAVILSLTQGVGVRSQRAWMAFRAQGVLMNARLCVRSIKRTCSRTDKQTTTE